MYNHRNRYPLRSKLGHSKQPLSSASSASSPLQQLLALASLSLDDDNKENDNHANSIMSPVESKETNADTPFTNGSTNGSSISDSSTSSNVSRSDFLERLMLEQNLERCSFYSTGDSTLDLYGELQRNPDSVLLEHSKMDSIPCRNREVKSLAFSQLLELQDTLGSDGQRRISVRQAFSKHHDYFSVRGSDSVKQDVDVGFLRTQARLPTWMSTLQRNLLLGKVKGDLCNYTPDMDSALLRRVIPQATSDDIKMVDEVTSVEELASGGYKQIFDAGDGVVLLQYPDGEDYDSRDLMVTQLGSGLSAVSPNFPRLRSSPFSDVRNHFLYVQMPKFEMNLGDYACRLESVQESSKASVLMGVGVQICFGVLAGQSILGLHFRDLKPSNIMLDGDDTCKYYLMTFGSKAFIFESITEQGYGTAMIIDHSTSTVAASASSISDFEVPFSHELSTLCLTPLESYLLDKILKGFHRDVHNIMLMLIAMFAPKARLYSLQVPESFNLALAKNIEPSDAAQCCYQQLVLLSKPGSSIIDVISNDPTFQRSSKFQAFKEANKMLLESKEFAEDVEMYSLRQGSEFSVLRELLGVDNVELLWKGMAPNQALRPTLAEFMVAFFKDHITKVEPSHLRHWYKNNVDDNTEVIPLFLDESHAEALLGESKDSFVLKSDQE